MFERILVPLDGSEVAEMAISYGEELASRLGSEVVLYHVHEPGHQQLKRVRQSYLDMLSKTVEHNIRKLRPQNAEVKVTTIVDLGEPAENICNLVENTKLDLIIMTAASSSGLKLGKKLGSVTDHVCRTVSIPVMLVRPQSTRRTEANLRLINRILIPMDGSEFSKLALSVGEELSSKLKVSATLFQMANSFRFLDNETGGIYVDYTKLNEDEEKRVRAEMIAVETELKRRGLNVTQIVTTGSDAAGEIIDLCKKIDADLVVMSTHGRSGLGRWFIGGVAERVLRYGETPLLLVHAKAG